MMNNELRPYDKYKETNFDWLAEIPIGWELTKLSTKFFERRTKVSDKDYMPLSVTKKGIVPQLSTAAKSNDGDNRKLVKKGDFVINSRSDRKGSSGLSPLDGSVSLINIVLEPQNIKPEYAHYLFKSNSFIEEYYRNGRGIVADLWTTRFTEMKNIYIPIPSDEEQDQIVKYLDYKLVKINKFIKAKKKLIAILKEQKLAIINQAVTKGLDPDVKMKPSGIEWLGNVPEHWEIRRLKNIGNAIIGLTYNPGEVTDETGTLVLRSSNIQNGGIVLNDNVYVKKVIPTHLKTKVGDILVCSRNGSRKLIGKCGMIDEVTKDLSFGAFTTIFRSDSNDFVYYLFNSMLFTYQIGSFFTSTINQLTINNFKSLIVPFPPKYEQERIVNYLRKELVALEKSISTIEQEVELINEFKNSLITNAVTGKIDVRNILIEEIDRENADEVDFDVEDENEIEEELIDEGGDE